MRILLIWIALAGSAAAGTVTGTVVENGFRVAEFAVRIDREPVVAVADFDGRFTLTDIDDGPHRLTLVGWAFRTTHVDIDVHGKTNVGTLLVEEGRRAVGHVVDKDQQPVAGATVVAYENPPNAIGPPLEMMLDDVRSATSSADGSFVIEGLPDADATVAIEAIDGERKSIEQQIAPHDYTAVELVVALTGTISGTVANHRRLASPVVRATPVGATGKAMIGGINPRGHFELDVPAGVYDLTLDEEHQAPLQIVVVENRTSKAELAAPASHADLVVTSSGCSVATLLGARPHERVPRTEVDAQLCAADQVRFERLAPGAYVVCVDGDCQPVTVRASPRMQRLQFVAPEATETDDTF